MKKIINASKLELKYKVILRHRYVKQESLEEVGKKFGVTRERIRQIETRALERLETISN